MNKAVKAAVGCWVALLNQSRDCLAADKAAAVVGYLEACWAEANRVVKAKVVSKVVSLANRESRVNKVSRVSRVNKANLPVFLHC
jgi:hypothetical protein